LPSDVVKVKFYRPPNMKVLSGKFLQPLVPMAPTRVFLLKGKISIANLLFTSSFLSAAFCIENIFSLFTKQVILMKRSNIQRLPVQLGFDVPTLYFERLLRSNQY
jgi:hypothetical protein